MLAFGALIGMPLIFAAIGFLFGLLEGLLLNLFTRWLGKVELNLEW